MLDFGQNQSQSESRSCQIFIRLNFWTAFFRLWVTEVMFDLGQTWSNILKRGQPWSTSQSLFLHNFLPNHGLLFILTIDKLLFTLVNFIN